MHPKLLLNRSGRSFGTPHGAASLVPCARFDQGATGTCHAHSAAGAIWTALNAAGKPLPWVPSPLLIASTTYADVQGPADKRGPLQDTGADLSDDATALSTWGIGPLSTIQSGRYSDVPDPASAFPEPDASAVIVAGADLISGEYQIPVDSSAPNLCALALDAGNPLWVGFLCDAAFERLGPYDVAQPPNESDPTAGGHAVYLSGYRTASGGSFEWLLQNSWGSGWADNGAVWCSTAWLLKCWLLWPMSVKVSS